MQVEQFTWRFRWWNFLVGGDIYLKCYSCFSLGKFKVIGTIKNLNEITCHLISVTVCELDHVSPNTLKDFKQPGENTLKVKVGAKTGYYHKYQPRNWTWYFLCEIQQNLRESLLLQFYCHGAAVY